MKKNEFDLRINLDLGYAGGAEVIVYDTTASDDTNVADILRKAVDCLERMGKENNRSYNVGDLKNVLDATSLYLTEEDIQ